MTNAAPTPSRSELLDLEDKLDSSLSKADAMASMISGVNFESFLKVNDDLKERYIWALHDMIMEAKLARNVTTNYELGAGRGQSS